MIGDREAATAPAPAVRGPAAAVLASLRPRQWVKNLLVVAAPLAAARIDERDVALATLGAFGAFCLVASAVYLVNDVHDVTEDRRHPVKRNRPIAAGLLAPRLALTIAAVLLATGLALGAVVSLPLAVTLAVYAAMQVAYTVFLKSQPVVDIAVVAGGFLLRAIAGGVASGIPLSQWFLLVAAFGSLFMIAGKRYSEIRSVGADAGTRRSLVRYSESYLRFVWSLAAAVTVTAYSLWAFDIRAERPGVPWEALSIAPFVLGMLRYAVDIDAGTAGEPEDIVLADRVLQVIAAIWLVLLGLGVFGG